MTEGALKLTGYCTRCGGECYDDGERMIHRCPPVRPEAAAIVSLRAENERLRAALVKISTFGNTGHGPFELANIAAAALGRRPHEQKGKTDG